MVSFSEGIRIRSVKGKACMESTFSSFHGIVGRDVASCVRVPGFNSQQDLC